MSDNLHSEVAESAAALRLMLGVLGLPTSRAEAMGRKTEEAGAEGALLDFLAEIRIALRKEKHFELADLIRERLGDMGYELRDLPDGKWEIKRKL